MRILIVCIFAVLTAVPMTVHGRQLSRNYTIEIEVECVEEARKAIAELSGFNIDSWAHLAEGQRSASYTRRVEGWAFRHAQEVLRGLGEVHYENENARYLGGELLNIETRIRVLTQEIERLSAMLAASETLEVLIAVNDRLTWVTRDRDLLIGRRRMLTEHADSVVVNIMISEPPAYVPRPEPEGFGARVSAAFINSWENTVAFGGNLLVVFARVGLPLLIWAVLPGAVALVVVLAVRKKWRKAEAAEGKLESHNALKGEISNETE